MQLDVNWESASVTAEDEAKLARTYLLVLRSWPGSELEREQQRAERL